MKFSDSKRHVLLLLMVMVTLFIGFVSKSIAQEDTGTVTGRVIDLDGNPVVGLQIFIAPLDLDPDGHMWTVF